MISKITPSGRKWIAETDALGMLQRSPPLTSKKLAQEWLDAKSIDAKFGDSSERLMTAAIVKGLVEYDDGTRFFGSTMVYTYHLENAVRRGFVTESNAVTPFGLEWYERCLKQLPQTRQVFWTSGVGMPSDMGEVPAS